MSFDVVVVGSVNRDLSVVTERMPVPGETILGSTHVYGPGGKGANQAVAAARLGASVAFVGRVGNDEDGRAMVANLESEGVDTTGVSVSETAHTGLAVILVDSTGENSIIVSAGANLELSAADIAENAAALQTAAVVLAQLEAPTPAVKAAFELAGGTTCLNPAPARPLDADLLELVDVLIPNRSELGLLASIPPPSSIEDALAAARELEVEGDVVVTLGGSGALHVASEEVVFPPRVEVVDTTGAGDAFCGALAVELGRGEDIAAAVRFAVAAGAAATTRLGAQSGLPTRAEVESVQGG